VKVHFGRKMARVHLPKKPNPEGTGRAGQGPGRPSQATRGSRQSTGSTRNAGQENEGGRANQNVRRISSVGDTRQAEKREVPRSADIQPAGKVSRVSAAGKVTKVTTKPAANNLAVAATAVAKPAAGVAAALTFKQGGGRGRGNSKVSVDDNASPPVKRTRGRKAKKEGNAEPSPMDVRNNGGLASSNNSHDLTNKTGGGGAIAKTHKMEETDAVINTAAAMDTSPVLPAVNGTEAAPQTEPMSAAAPVNTAVDTPAVVNGAPVVSDKMFVGCHASASGGVHNAVTDAVKANAKSFALFLRNQRSWTSKPLDQEVADSFKKLCAEHNFPPHLILPHGSYLLNLGSPEVEKREKSVRLLVEELERCQKLGLTMFNIHPGSSCGQIGREECVQFIAEGVNQALQQTIGVKIVLENMSGQGHTIGGDFRELRAIIDKVVDKSRIGVCLDTCHAMAYGYDLSSQDGFDRLIKEFSEQVGFSWLLALHVNDSKGEAGCHLDRHENIGRGKIGKEGFKRIMNCNHFRGLPLILETPFDSDKGYGSEISMLSEMVV
jgi:AP endonuclease-1